MSKMKKITAFALAFLFALSLVACDGSGENDDQKQTQSAKQSVTGVVTKAGETTTTVSGKKSKDKKSKDKKSKDKKSSKKGKKKAQFTTKPVLRKKVNVTTQGLIARTTNRAGNASAKFVKSLKGFTLKILYPWENIYGATKCKSYYTKSMNDVKKAYGIKIKEEGKWDRYNESLAAELASKKCANHIYYAQEGNFASYFKKGYISDLASAMREAAVDFNDPWYFSDAKGFLNINGKQYGWVPVEDEYTTPFMIIYNKTLLARKSLTDPATLAEKGKWTWSTLETYAKKFDNDKSVTGMGTIDSESMVEAIATQLGTALTKVKKGQSPTTNITDSKVKSALETFSSWCVGKKAWCDTFKGEAWNYAKNKLVNGKLAMIFGFHDTVQNLKSAKDNSVFGIAPFPTKNPSKKFTSVSIAQFIAFIPIVHQKIAAKILFARNEYYRYTYRYADRCARYRWESYLGDGNAVTNAINIKYGKKGNKSKMTWTSVCEDAEANVTTLSIVNEIKNGKGVATAISGKKKALANTYKKVWKGYKITGNV